MDVPQARRLERPGWVNGRTVLGLMLFVAAVAGGQRIIEASSTTIPVWILGRDLPTGAVLGADDLRTAEVVLPAELSSDYARATTDIIGAVATRPIRAGEMIPLAVIAPSGTSIDGRLITIPASPEHAVGGDIRVGDTVEVYATLTAEQEGVRTELLVPPAEVVDVMRTEALVAGASALAGVTILISPEDVSRVVLAMRTGEIDIVKVTGAASSAVTVGGDSSER